MPVVTWNSAWLKFCVQIKITSLWKGIISICLYPFRLFELFYKYRPDRADTWCWRGIRPSGRQKEIVLAAAKMENIKWYWINDCNLTKPLQEYLTRHTNWATAFWKGKQWQHRHATSEETASIQSGQNFSNLRNCSVFFLDRIFYLYGASTNDNEGGQISE